MVGKRTRYTSSSSSVLLPPSLSSQQRITPRTRSIQLNLDNWDTFENTYDHDDGNGEEEEENNLEEVEESSSSSPPPPPPEASIRNRVKRYIYGGSSNQNMVQHIPLDGGKSNTNNTPREEDERTSSTKSGNNNTNGSTTRRGGGGGGGGGNDGIIRPNFDTLFEGMPKLNEIIGDKPKMDAMKQQQQLRSRDPSLSSQKSPNPPPFPSSSTYMPPNDDNDDNSNNDTKDKSSSGLSQQDQDEIDENYKLFQSDMQQKLAKLREENPESVPENSDFILNQVVEEQKANEVEQRLEMRAMENFQDYEREKRKVLLQLETEVVNDDGSSSSSSADGENGLDPVVKEIMEEAEQIQSEKQSTVDEYNDFAAYEQSMREESNQRLRDLQSSSTLPSSSSSKEEFDQVQLDLMEGLLSRLEEQDVYTDIDMKNNIENGIDELKENMAKTKKLEPQSMKEWQMYRAIATKLANKKNAESEEFDETLEGSLDETISDEEDSEEIGKKLQAWQEFQQKEEEMRKKAGLAINVRMPFAWDEKQDSKDTDAFLRQRAAAAGPIDRVKFEEARKDLDELAVQVLNDLMAKTNDPERRLKIQGEIDALKNDMKDRVNVEGEQGQNEAYTSQKIKSEPMTMSSVLKSTSKPSPAERTVQYVKTESTPTPVVPDPVSVENEWVSSGVDEGASYVADGKGNEIAANDEDGDDAPKLGTFEEQRLRSMVARSGVKTAEEEEKLRNSWREFQEAEKIMRDSTGLSGDRDASGLEYDVSDYIKDDGEVNFDQILGSIGQRPSRKAQSETQDSYVDDQTSPESSIPPPPKSAFFSEEEDEEEEETIETPTTLDRSNSYAEFQEYERILKEDMLKRQKLSSKGSIAVTGDSAEKAEDVGSKEEEKDVIIYHNQVTQWDSSNYSDQMYRAAGAANLSKEKGEAEKVADKTAFEEFLKQEEEMRNKIQDMSDNLNATTAAEDMNFDDYANEALSTIGTRPKIRKQEKPDVDSISRNNGRGSSRKTKDVKPRVESMKTKTKSSSSVLKEQMPDWLRREIKDSRGEEFEMEEDDLEDDLLLEESDEEYSKRESQAEEYERSQLGSEVDIGQVLGRDVFGPDNDDVSIGLFPSTFSSFNVRKANLLEYKVLTAADINVLMEHKHDVGVSPYLMKINKPFSNYGAIFRLEGVLVDIQGLQSSAWKKTAKQHNLPKPTQEDIEYASVHDAEYAIRRVFYWTDDMFISRDISETFHTILKEDFKNWLESNSNQTPVEEPSINGNESETAELNEPLKEEPKLSEAGILTIQIQAWQKVANHFQKPVPAPDMVAIGNTLDPEMAISAIYGWTNDSDQSKDMAQMYNSIVNESGIFKTADIPKSQNRIIEDETETQDNVSASDLFNVQLHGWNSAAERHNFPSPSAEQVELAMLSNDPERSIRDIMQWTFDEQQIIQITSTYREACRMKSNAILGNISDVNFAPQTTQPSDIPSEPSKENTGPTEEDVLKMQYNAWNKVAETYNARPVTMDEVQAASFFAPDDAVMAIFKWSEVVNNVDNIKVAYRNELKELSRKWVESVDSLADIKDTHEEVLPMFILKEGANKWLQALHDVDMPCVVTSFLNGEMLDFILQETRLDKYFPPDNRISSDSGYSGYEVEMQQMLGGALRAECRPDDCVVFGSTPQSAAYAHDVEMKHVALVSPYPYYELITADMTARDFDTMQVVNLKNIFSDDKNDEPMEEVQVDSPRLKRKRLLKTRFSDDL